MANRITIIENILNANDQIAAQNRQILNQYQVYSLNFMASPGAGKTSLIEKTISGLQNELNLAVIDGDIATSLDADRAASAGATAIQINTGGECHLDAVMINKALTALDLNKIHLLIVENVGNLICPASFQLGTHKSILITSVPEGDDKPYKYPGIFTGVEALVINKIDLLPYVSFNLDYFQKGVEILNPGLKTFHLSCRTGEGIDEWIAWIKRLVTEVHF